MPIKFHCPNPACARALTVNDAAAGRSTKCPGCGHPLVVPRPEAQYELEPVMTVSEFLPEPSPGAPARKLPDRDWEGGGEPVRAGGGPVVSFDAIGLAWGLLKRELGTWVVATILFMVAMIGAEILMMILAGVLIAVETGPLSMPFPMFTMLVLMVVAAMVQGTLMGGMYRMALNQIDGEEISVGDLFKVVPSSITLGLVVLLTFLLIGVGFAFLIVPGMILAGLTMFAIPGVVDGLGAMEAIKRSVGTLKRQWFMAPLFAFVVGLIASIGSACFGVGVLISMPLAVLSVAVQYRRSFRPEGVPRKKVVADPWAEAVGVPPRSGRVPAWAWGLLGLGLALPMVLFAAMMAAAIPAAMKAANEAAARKQMGGEARALAKGQGGFGPRAVAPPPAAPAGRVDLVAQAIEMTKKGGDRQGNGVSLLYTIGPDDQHHDAVVAVLTPLLGDPRLGGDAARGLDHWATPSDIPALIDGLESDIPRVRFFLLQALGRLKAEAAIPALVRHLAVPEDRFRAAEALRSIGAKAAPEVRKALESDDPEARREASNLLKQFGGNDPSVKMTMALAALKGGNDFERDRALQDLGRGPVVEESRGDVLAAVEPLLKDPKPSTRRAAIKALETWGTAEQASWLIAALDDADRIVRTAAYAAIRKFPDPKVGLELARRLAVADQRRQAADALLAMKLRDEQVEAQLIQALESPDANTRMSACQVLKVIGTEASIPALKKATADAAKNVAAAARNALQAIDPLTSTDEAKPKMTTPRKKR